MQRFLSLVSIAIALASPVALGYPRGVHRSRVLLGARDVDESYDYVIVGGGTAGLTVADRLTEDGKTTVLVVEHGELSISTHSSAYSQITAQKQSRANTGRQAIRLIS